MAVIEVCGVEKSFSHRAVLRDLSFTVDEGDYLCIVGENGAGKTTLLRLMLGLSEPDSGEIRYNGIKKTDIGYLPQATDAQSDFPASAKEVVLSGTLSEGRLPFYSREDKQKAEKIMRRLDIFDLSRRSFFELSGGQQRRVMLARALCASRKVLLLDEPLAGLDPVAAADFYTLMDDLNHSGLTVIMVSHDVSCAVHHSRKILHLGENDRFFGGVREYAESDLGKRMLARGHCFG